MYKLRTNSYVLKQTKRSIKSFFLVFLLITCANLHVSAQKLVTLKFKNKALKEVFKDLHNAVGVKFVYSSSGFDANKVVSGDFNGSSLDQVLKHVLSDQNVAYTIQDNTVAIKRVEPTQIQQKVVQGKINDEQGKPLANVIVRAPASGES